MGLEPTPSGGMVLEKASSRVVEKAGRREGGGGERGGEAESRARARATGARAESQSEGH